MEKERLKWVLGGLDRGKLSQFERQLIERIGKKQPEDLTLHEEDELEKIYRFKSR